MEHRKVSSMLISAGALATLGGAGLFLFYAPATANECRIPHGVRNVRPDCPPFP